jgi:phosphoglycolate phosphatase-like HAD superfamily hydrolase
MTHVLFWDIDGTLLTTARAGVFALEDAAREVCGTTPDFSQLVTSGLTDHEVAVLSIETVGAEASPEQAARFLRFYESRLPDRLPLREGRVLPGVHEVLADVAARPDVEQLLLTGNTPAGAAAKLRHYGLDGYFATGAFCADGEDRVTIARRALTVAREQLGEDPDPSLTYVIGDTPHDISCGKAVGAKTVAVATGAHPAEELETFGPWLVLEQLPEPERFAELLRLP